MKKIFLFITLAIIALSVSGCATASRFSFEDSGARFERANFHVVRTVSKECSSIYLFHVIGGSALKSELNKAVDEMSRELRPNQALAYVNVVKSFQLPVIPPFCFFSRVEYTINATIIEYDN